MNTVTNQFDSNKFNYNQFPQPHVQGIQQNQPNELDSDSSDSDQHTIQKPKILSQSKKISKGFKPTKGTIPPQFRKYHEQRALLRQQNAQKQINAPKKKKSPKEHLSIHKVIDLSLPRKTYSGEDIHGRKYRAHLVWMDVYGKIHETTIYFGDKKRSYFVEDGNWGARARRHYKPENDPRKKGFWITRLLENTQGWDQGWKDIQLELNFKA